MESRNSFKGSIGFVLAAAGSAVGLGNIWRFPYLAAKDGGGLFLVVYLILLVTFGFALLTAEVAIGRKTKQSPLTAYDKLHKGFKPLGVIACLVPAIIMPYYCAIGGWVLKYFLVFVAGYGKDSAADGFFVSFITSMPTIFYMLVFLLVTAYIIYKGVNHGIEKSSKIIMPVLILLVIGIAVFSLTLKNTDDAGETRTAMQGLAIYVIPNLSGITFSQLFTVIMDAMCQLFFSLSIAMGIMVAYGSYVSDEANLSQSINHIEIFDTGVAFLAGLMVVPAVYVFMGQDGLGSAGPGLIFVTLPKVFEAMGPAGGVIGVLFFALVLFAALTSCVSIMEAVVSSFMDQFKLTRTKATVVEGVIAIVLAIIVCLGYNVFYFDYTLPNGSVGQILDIMDYISNNVLMPLVAIGTCILVGWVIKPDAIIGEVTKNGEKFLRAGLFRVMIRYIAPIMLIALFLKSVGILSI